jgi:hypothetical protein
MLDQDMPQIALISEQEHFCSWPAATAHISGPGSLCSCSLPLIEHCTCSITQNTWTAFYSLICQHISAIRNYNK